jgi:hypothetical protein
MVKGANASFFVVFGGRCLAFLGEGMKLLASLLPYEGG